MYRNSALAVCTVHGLAVMALIMAWIMLSNGNGSDDIEPWNITDGDSTFHISLLMSASLNNMDQ